MLTMMMIAAMLGWAFFEDGSAVAFARLGAGQPKQRSARELCDQNTERRLAWQRYDTLTVYRCNQCGVVAHDISKNLGRCLRCSWIDFKREEWESDG